MPGLKSWILGLFRQKEARQAEPETAAVARPAVSEPPAVEPVLPEEPILPAALPDEPEPLIAVSVGPADAPPPVEDPVIGRRARRAAEALMENESLMPDLDSRAAQALLEWGIACARQAAAGSAGLDDTDAEQVMAPRMQATRQMMKAINRWVGRAGEASDEVDAQVLEKILDFAASVYGGRSKTLTADKLQEILQEAERFRQQPDQSIVSLRRSLESQFSDQE